MKYDEEIISAKLQEWRKRQGFTQQQVADWLGIKLKTYQFYEQNRRKLSLETLFSLCELYLITPNDLLGYVDIQSLNILCNRYGIKYNDVNDNIVKLTTTYGDTVIQKDVLCEILLTVERELKDTIFVDDNVDLDNIKNHPKYSAFIDVLLNAEIKRRTNPYTVEQMMQDLKRIKSDDSGVIIKRKKGGK